MRAAVPFLALFLFASCGQEPSETEVAPPHSPRQSIVQALRAKPPLEREGQALPAKQTLEPQVALTEGRKLVRDAGLVIVATDTKAASSEVEALVEGLGGYVESLDAKESKTGMRYEMVLRVPSDQLDAALDALKGLSVHVVRETLSTRDVTAQWIDLDARLKTLVATEDELRQLLGKASERGDFRSVVSIHQELVRIRSQIESLERQQRTLDGQIAYARIQLSLRPADKEAPRVHNRWRPLATLRTDFGLLVAGLRVVADRVMFLIVVVLPLLVLVGTPLFLLVRLFQRVRAHR